MSDTPLRLVLFDFDGTLCDSAATIIRLMKQACDLCDLPVPEDSFIRGNIGYGVSHAALSYADGNPEKASKLAEIYRHIARNEYLSGQPPLDPLFDGAKDILRTLQSKDYLTGIITNKSRTGLDSLITRHGLDQQVDLTITADDCTVKPAPDMVLLAMRQTRVDKGETILVGDTEIDAGCAANAGIAFIGVSWGYHSPGQLTDMGALHILSTFAELPAVISRQYT